MNYEKPETGYFWKTFGTCAAVLGLAAIPALFMPNKPATAQPLEKIVRKETLNCGEKTTISATVRDSVGEDYKSRNFDTRKASRAVATGQIKSCTPNEATVSGTTLADITFGDEMIYFDSRNMIKFHPLPEREDGYKRFEPDTLRQINDKIASGNYQKVAEFKRGIKFVNVIVNGKKYEVEISDNKLRYSARDENGNWYKIGK